MTAELSLREKSQTYLSERWNNIIQILDQKPIIEPLDDNYSKLKQKIKKCLTSNIKSYRYVLPTQLLSKSVDHSLDCRSLQVADDSEGSFDARTIAHKVIVPFDSENHNVLGGSKEPYVNNPLRCPAVSNAYRERQRNKNDWDNLIFILNEVQSRNDDRTISDRFKLFEDIKREKVNVADASSGMAADIECWLNGEIVLLIEVKDRCLTLTQLNAKIDLARSNQIKEILFMAQQGIDESNKNEIHKKISQEFTSGQNIYVSNLFDFAKGILTILGEKGRVDFINKIGSELDRSKSSIRHRKAWANLLREI